MGCYDLMHGTDGTSQQDKQWVASGANIYESDYSIKLPWKGRQEMEGK